MTVKEALEKNNCDIWLERKFDEYFDDYSVEDVQAFVRVIKNANIFIENFEIGFADDWRFFSIYMALVSKNIFPIMARAMFLKQSKALFKTEAWRAATKNIVEFDTGYQGFNAPANSSFRKDKQSSESYIDNPIIFAQAIRDLFNDDIERFISEVKLYCLEVY